MLIKAQLFFSTLEHHTSTHQEIFIQFLNFWQFALSTFRALFL